MQTYILSYYVLSLQHLIHFTGLVSPVFGKSKNGLDLKEIINLCVAATPDKSKVCTSVPEPQENSYFLVDMNSVQEKDLTCDDCGIYDKHSSPSALVSANIKNGTVVRTKVITRVRELMTEKLIKQENNYVVKRFYSEQSSPLGKATRIIHKVYQNEKICRYSVVQFFGKHVSILKPHGNNKSSDPYMRTKRSVLDKARYLAEHMSPKQVISLIESDNGNLIDNNSSSDSPMNRQQIYNLKKKIEGPTKSRNTGPVKKADFEKLILQMDTCDFITDINFHNDKGRIHSILLQPQQIVCTIYASIVRLCQKKKYPLRLI